MITACSCNSVIGIKYISYWFMSCLLSAFSSVWIYTISQVSSDILLCRLAERRNGLTPPLLFVWLFEESLCRCSLQPLRSAPLGFLSLVLTPSSLQHSSMVCIVEMWQSLASGGNVSRCSWEYLVCCHTLNIPLSPSLPLFFLLSEFGSGAGSAG